VRIVPGHRIGLKSRNGMIFALSVGSGKRYAKRIPANSSPTTGSPRNGKVAQHSHGSANAVGCAIMSAESMPAAGLAGREGSRSKRY
jgi:hypothetical protein